LLILLSSPHLFNGVLDYRIEERSGTMTGTGQEEKEKIEKQNI
jgi:hypothetical protein